MERHQEAPPRQRQGLLSRLIDDESIVLDPDADTVHTLNPTATAVWDLLDGAHSVDDLARALCERFDTQPEKAARDIAKLLERFRRLNLLEPPPA